MHRPSSVLTPTAQPAQFTPNFSTFNNSGSSSKLVERNQLPKGVKRSESGNGLPAASIASRMVRNFTISNGLPSLPGRTCLNSTGEPKFLRIFQATMAMIGDNTSKPKKEAKMSKRRFIILGIHPDYSSANAKHQTSCALTPTAPASPTQPTP